MADGSIYVAIISASAAILGAAVSAVSIAYQNARQAERDRRQRREERQQRHEEEARTACLDLLRAAVDLRTQVENNKGYQGEEMRSRLARVRQYASDAALCGVLIGTIEPDVFAELADKLAKAARSLALAAAESTNLEMNMSTEVPDLGELNDCIEAFSRKAVAYAKGET
jgi:transaldolase